MAPEAVVRVAIIRALKAGAYTRVRVRTRKGQSPVPIIPPPPDQKKKKFSIVFCGFFFFKLTKWNKIVDMNKKDGKKKTKLISAHESEKKKIKVRTKLCFFLNWTLLLRFIL